MSQERKSANPSSFFFLRGGGVSNQSTNQRAITSLSAFLSIDQMRVIVYISLVCAVVGMPDVPRSLVEKSSRKSTPPHPPPPRPSPPPPHPPPPRPSPPPPHPPPPRPSPPPPHRNEHHNLSHVTGSNDALYVDMFGHSCSSSCIFDMIGDICSVLTASQECTSTESLFTFLYSLATYKPGCYYDMRRKYLCCVVCNNNNDATSIIYKLYSNGITPVSIGTGLFGKPKLQNGVYPPIY